MYDNVGRAYNRVIAALLSRHRTMSLEHNSHHPVDGLVGQALKLPGRTPKRQMALGSDAAFCGLSTACIERPESSTSVSRQVRDLRSSRRRCVYRVVPGEVDSMAIFELAERRVERSCSTATTASGAWHEHRRARQRVCLSHSSQPLHVPPTDRQRTSSTVPDCRAGRTRQVERSDSAL